MFPISRFRDKGQIILAVFLLFTIGLYLIRNGYLGSNTDWMCQHTVFPDYFRRLFYETGDLFPNYAANIGAGQNIYNFSYYGYLNPMILLSYLMPFASMPIYIMTTSLISLSASCLLFYHWLKAKGFSAFITISASMIFLLASPMLYQSYKQIVFVNYMPFLCLALIGVDRFLNTGRKRLLSISVFLMIMSSFYFSVSGLFAIGLYWLSAIIKRNAELSIGKLFRNGIRFMIPIMTAVLMAGILLVPTFFSLLESHRSGQASTALYTLFIPQFRLLRYVYNPYGIGLSSITITVLLTGLFSKNRSERFLSISMILITAIPIFSFILNGGLYVQDKALIPFLPIVCYLMALFFQKLQERKELRGKRLFIAFLGTIILTLFSIGQTEYWIIALLDGLLMAMLCLLYLKRNTVKLFIFPVVGILLTTNFVVQNPGKLVSRDIYQKIFDPDIKTAMQEIISKDPSFYRMDSLLNKDNNLNRIYSGGQYLTSFYSSSFQKDYFNFRNDIFQLERPYRNYLMQPASQNPLFLTFMGVKYVYSDYAPVGYERYNENNHVKIYRNKNASSLGYVTNNLISEKELVEYEFPYRQELLMNYAAVNRDNSNGEFRTKIQPVTLNFTEINAKDFTLASEHGVFRVKAVSDTDSFIKLPQPAEEDEVVFIQMNVRNLSPLNDISMKIQNEQNRLSAKNHIYYNQNTVFHYAVSVKKGGNALPVTFSAGKYELSGINGYTLYASDLASIRMNSPFTVSSTGTRGNVISGTVNASKDGYFITTIPYDESFKIIMDGKEISYEKVNTAFMGFPITKGRHHIVFHYISPGFTLGAAASILGFLLFAYFALTDRRGGHDTLTDQNL